MVSCLHKDIGISRTLTARVIAVCILTGLNEMDLLTTAEERMSLEENDFQYLSSKPCFSHSLLSSLENRKTSWHVQIPLFHVTLSQLGGAHNLTLFRISFAIGSLCKDMKTPIQQKLP